MLEQTSIGKCLCVGFVKGKKVKRFPALLKEEM
jgi:hypothetical protein